MSYVLVGLAIMSLSIMVVSRMGNKTNDSKRMVEVRDEVTNQVALIRSKLIACSVFYPGGNNGLGYRPQLPITPIAGVLSNVADGYVVDVLCPGNPNANKSIWSSSDGVYMPRKLTGLGDWKYIHDATSARISVAAIGAGAINLSALTNVALRIGSQASVTGSALTVVIAN